MKKKIFIASAIVIGLLIFFAGLQNRTVHLPFSDEEVSYSDMWEKKQYSKIIEYGSTVLEKNPMDRNTLIFTGYAYFYQGISILDMDERNSCMEKAVASRSEITRLATVLVCAALIICAASAFPIWSNAVLALSASKL